MLSESQAERAKRALGAMLLLFGFWLLAILAMF